MLLEYPDTIPEGRRAERAFDALQVFKARTLLERMLGPGGSETPALTHPAVTCRQLQQETLDPGELLLDFYLSPDLSILFALTRSECRATRLPGSEILDPKLRLFREFVSSAPEAPGSDGWRKTLDRSTAEMGDLLFDPIGDLLAQAKSAIIAPDGELNLIPLHLLLPPDERETRVRDGPAGARSIHTVPSATILAELRMQEGESREPSAGYGSILAVAGKVSGTGEALSGAREEVRYLARRFGKVTVGLPSEPSLPEGLARFEILHFAAHSTVDDQYPWRSAIHLEDQGANPASIRLQAFQIAERKLTARLAVLSSCRSAGGHVLSGEGVQGLASAFLSAGVPAVLASLWEVDDQATARLVRRFYDGLGRGRSAAQALAEAQASLRDSPETGQPFYWAGFVLIGDGGIHSSLSPRRRPAASLLPWALALVVVIGFVTRIIRRNLRPRSCDFHDG